MNAHLSETASLLQSGLVHLLMNPLVYLGVALVIYELVKSARFEKQFLGLRVTRIRRGSAATLGLGLLVGVVMSLLMAVLGIVVKQSEVWLVTAVSCVFAIIRLRLSSPIYVVAFLGLCSFLVKHFHLSDTGHGIAMDILQTVEDFSVTNWLAICSFVFLSEGLLYWMRRKGVHAPTVVLGKRGRSIGALVVRLSFLLPLFPLVEGSHAVHPLPSLHWPLLASVLGGINLSCLPALIGFSGVMTTRPPRRYISSVTRLNLTMGIVGIALAIVIHHNGGLDSLNYILLVLAVVAKEWVLFANRRHEALREPIFSQSEAGVRILGTLPKSLAHSMELRAGEIISHVNQIPVHTPYDLHFAFDQNPAYAKLNVFDERGEVRIVGKPVYSGERTKLGLILVPDGFGTTGQTMVTFGAFHTVYAKVSRKQQSVLTESLGVNEPPSATMT